MEFNNGNSQENDDIVEKLKLLNDNEIKEILKKVLDSRENVEEKEQEVIKEEQNEEIEDVNDIDEKVIDEILESEELISSRDAQEIKQTQAKDFSQIEESNQIEETQYTEESNPIEETQQVEEIHQIQETVDINPQSVNEEVFEQNMYPVADVSVLIDNLSKDNRKTSVGTKILITCLSVLLALAIGTIVVLGDFLPSTAPVTDPTEGGSSQTEPATEDVTRPPNTGNPDGPEINLITQPQDIAQNTQYNASNAFENAHRSVVGVIVKNDDGKTIGSGSGVVISSDGYILTNSHVVDDSYQTLAYVVANEKEYKAEIIGLDTRTDLAVIKIDTNEDIFVPAIFANSDDLLIGQEVAAIGNPGGIVLSNTITQGIVSSTNREIETGGNVKYIQTDSAINPGNSGGPLVNFNGEVVGINTIKVVSTEYEGIGFAIPSTTVKEIADDLIKNGFITDRSRLGITGMNAIEGVNIPIGTPKGVSIEVFDDDCVIDDNGGQLGDIITHIDNVRIESITQLYAQLELHLPNDEITITVFRLPEDKNPENGESITIDIVLLADKG